MTIHVRQLKLILEIGHSPQSANDHTQVVFPSEVDGQSFVTNDFDIIDIGQGGSCHRDAFVRCKKRRLGAWVVSNCDDNAIEKRRRPSYQIFMTQCDGIECSRIHGGDGHLFAPH